MLANTREYLDVLERVKQDIARTQAKAALRASAELIRLYWRIGCEINARLDWGKTFIDSLARDIRQAYPGMKGFSSRSLRYMAKLAREVNEEFLQQVVAKIPWGHAVCLMNKTDPGAKREWYARSAIENGWSRAVLEHQIDTHLYERQMTSGKVTNFERTLPPEQSELVQQALKDPYVFDFITARQSTEERDVEQAMMDNLTQLLLELGTGFTFAGRQYHLRVGQSDFYIDLLFYNVRLHCYVVVELKNEAFKPEFSGKLGFYVAAVDGELCGEGDNPTVGLLLCKTKDDVVAEYSLRATNAPIGVSEYRLGDELPAAYAGVLPSPEDLAARL